MTRTSQLVIGALGIALTGSVAAGLLIHRDAQRRYQEAMASRRQLELQYGEVLATHDQLERELNTERQRSTDLAEALKSIRLTLEESVGRLANEMRAGRELQMRLAAMQKQMDQLQGELSLTLQERQSSSKAEQAGGVQLERIVVSPGDAPELKGRIVSVHSDWNFVVVNLGWNAVHIGETISIFRNEQLLAKARIERVQEGISAATLLPEWETADVQVNDLVRVL